MAGFESAVLQVIENEGGLVDDPDDPGGITNYGISLRWALSEMSAAGDDEATTELFDMDGDGDVDVDDIRRMTVAEARALYKTYFWDRYHYGEMRTQPLAAKMLDTSVNTGPTQAHKFLQRALWSTGHREIVDDGILGPLTLGAVWHAPASSLIAALRSEQGGFYRALVMRNAALRRRGADVHDFTKFQRGWLRRAYA